MEVRAYYRALRREQKDLTWKPRPAEEGASAHTRTPSPSTSRPAQTSWASPGELVAFRNGMARKGSTEAGMAWLLGEG